MYRISVMTAGMAVAIGISIGGAAAQSCDDRIAGSCPLQFGTLTPPEPEAAASTEAAEPRSHARRGKNARVKKRARQVARSASRKKSTRAAIVRKKPPVRQTAGATEDVSANEPVPVADRGRGAETRVAAMPAVDPSSAPAAPFATASAQKTIGSLPGSVSPLSSAFAAPQGGATAPVTAGAPPPVATGEMTGSTSFDPTAAQESSSPVASPPAPKAMQVALAGNTGSQAASPAYAQQASAPGVPAPAETSWMRMMIMTFGGLLAAGSLIRMVV